jgi:hypothetical protein
VGGFTNASYWSSTEEQVSPHIAAWATNFATGVELSPIKSTNDRVRCVRSFTP